MNISHAIDNKKPATHPLKMIFGQIKYSEWLILTLIVIMALTSIALQQWNPIHYPYQNGAALQALMQLPGVLTLLALISLSRKRWQHPTWQILCAIVIVMIFFLQIFQVGLEGASNVLLTPHTRIDAALATFDQHLGVNVTHLMAWTRQYPWFLHLLQTVYSSWIPLAISIPIIICTLGKSSHSHYRYITSWLLTIFIGCTIYFFWPTSAPASVYHSPYFTLSQHHLVTAFYQVHHNLPMTVQIDGLIAFPSFHVIDACLVTFACLDFWWLLIPVAIWNSLQILSTMALGYHYLADVLAGILIAIICHFIADYWLKKLKQKELSKAQ